jgi:uncharacterized protein YdeI (YjbR/CyaY-like superfamily)
MTGEAYIRKPKGTATHYLELDYKKAKAFIQKHGRRVVLQLNGGPAYHRALQLRKNGYALILLSQALLRENNLENHLKVNYAITADESTYGMPMPEEFKEVLAQEPKAKAAFEALTPGRQRGLLHYAASAKSVESRIKRALELAHKLKTGCLHSG